MNKQSIKLSDRSRQTLIRLEAALERLLNGKPEKTPNDGRISISRVNSEAGLSVGSIYYYKQFVEEVRIAIEDSKRSKSNTTSSKTTVNYERLRNKRDDEKRLKEKYRVQRDEIKEFCDRVVSKNAYLEFSLFEALAKIDWLEAEIRSMKVIDINKLGNEK